MKIERQLDLLTENRDELINDIDSTSFGGYYLHEEDERDFMRQQIFDLNESIEELEAILYKKG